MSKKSKKKRQDRVILLFSIVILLALLSPYFINRHQDECHGHNSSSILYDFSYREAREQEGQPLGRFHRHGSQPDYDFAISGNLEMQATSHNEQDQSIWSIQLKNLNVQGDIDPYLMKDLRKPFHIELDSQCRIQRFGFFPQSPKRANQLIEKILFATEFVVEKEQEVWQVKQLNQEGPYLSSYQKKTEGLMTKIHKQILSYSSPIIIDNSAYKSRMVRSSGFATFNRFIGYYEQLEAYHHSQLIGDKTQDLYSLKTEVFLKSVEVNDTSKIPFVGDIYWFDSESEIARRGAESLNPESSFGFRSTKNF